MTWTCFHEFQVCYKSIVSLALYENIHLHPSAKFQESKYSLAGTDYLVVMWLPEQQESWRTRLEPVAAGPLCVKACRSVALRPATTPENSSVRVISGDAVKAIYSHFTNCTVKCYLIKCVC